MPCVRPAVWAPAVLRLCRVLRDRAFERARYWAQRARGERIPSMEQRGYGPEPRRLRAEVARVVEAGRALCARCGGSIAPGTRWDLDHSDDRMGYIGPSHVRCNRATAGGRKGQGQEDAARGVVSRLW